MQFASAQGESDVAGHLITGLGLRLGSNVERHLSGIQFEEAKDCSRCITDSRKPRQVEAENGHSQIRSELTHSTLNGRSVVEPSNGR